jgi:hypothetical protein
MAITMPAVCTIVWPRPRDELPGRANIAAPSMMPTQPAAAGRHAAQNLPSETSARDHGATRLPCQMRYVKKQDGITATAATIQTIAGGAEFSAADVVATTRSMPQVIAKSATKPSENKRCTSTNNSSSAHCRPRIDGGTLAKRRSHHNARVASDSAPFAWEPPLAPTVLKYARSVPGRRGSSRTPRLTHSGVSRRAFHDRVNRLYRCVSQYITTRPTPATAKAAIARTTHVDLTEPFDAAAMNPGIKPIAPEVQLPI